MQGPPYSRLRNRPLIAEPQKWQIKHRHSSYYLLPFPTSKASASSEFAAVFVASAHCSRGSVCSSWRELCFAGCFAGIRGSLDLLLALFQWLASGSLTWCWKFLANSFWQAIRCFLSSSRRVYLRYGRQFGSHPSHWMNPSCSYHYPLRCRWTYSRWARQLTGQVTRTDLSPSRCEGLERAFVLSLAVEAESFVDLSASRLASLARSSAKILRWCSDSNKFWHTGHASSTASSTFTSQLMMSTCSDWHWEGHESED